MNLLVTAFLIASASAAPLVISSVGRQNAAFDQAVGEKMATYSGAAYCAGQSSVADWSCYACKMVPGLLNITSVYDKETDGRSIVGFDPDLQAAVVMFMGTNANIYTWIDDLKSAVLTPYPATGCANCSVGKGFYETMLGQKSQVYTALQHLPSNSSVYVTGHSLGGAVAALFALDYAITVGKPPAAVYTFGQPRTGNLDFAHYYASMVNTHWRSTHHRDPVPHLPYELMGFHHMTTEVYFSGDDGKTHKVCSSTDGEDSTGSDQFSGNIIYVEDHWFYLGFSYLQGLLRCTL